MNAAQSDDLLGFDPREIVAMFWRRWLWVVVPAILGTLAATAFVMMKEPMYRSSATLLIDSQQIPTSLVASPLTNIANERIGKIRQRIVSRESLTEIIRQQGIYKREQGEMPFDDVLNLMRQSIAVDLVGATGTDSGAGKTIAFTLSFTYEDAAAAQAVTRRLTEMFLSEDKRFRTEQATGTAAFLERRADELRRQLTSLEDRRRTIEARYAGALPTQVAMTAQSESALRAEISRIDAETQGLAQQSSLLAAREREIAQAPQPGSEALRRAEERLNQLSSTYADDFPDVLAARAAVARERSSLAARTPDGGANVIQSEIAASRSRIDMLASRRASLVGQVGDMDRRAAMAPQASYELTMVEREYDNLKRQYEDLREKQLEAQVAANLQTEDKGERFSIVDEPSMPYEPIGAKPLSLILTGLVGGAGAGFALILTFELMTGAIHGEASLTKLMGAPPMGVVPVVRTTNAKGLRAIIQRLPFVGRDRRHAT